MPELKKDIFLNGKTIYLRALCVDDISGNYRYWLNDEEVVHFNSHGRFPQTQDKLKDYVQSVHRSDNNLVLAVIDSKSEKHIGNISLQKIQWVDRNAEIAFLLGEKDFHGKGVMFEAGSLLIRHGFNILNLHRIYCGTSSENIGMQKLAAKLGMIQEGVRKEALFKNGKYLDLIEYGILRKQNVSK
ncbi:MAG: GNAT family N-acetyltransferase [Leptospiraceae bacterium]|nr:GNAT family N-acetyltransferase [Leptospiraceae bacterium]